MNTRDRGRERDRRPQGIQCSHNIPSTKLARNPTQSLRPILQEKRYKPLRSMCAQRKKEREEIGCGVRRQTEKSGGRRKTAGKQDRSFCRHGYFLPAAALGSHAAYFHPRVRLQHARHSLAYK
jgi:hypothetical protein